MNRYELDQVLRSESAKLESSKDVQARFNNYVERYALNRRISIEEAMTHKLINQDSMKYTGDKSEVIRSLF